MKAFVTGINGFAGSYLAEALIGAGHTVGGTVFTGTSTENISHIIGDLQLFQLDLTDKKALDSVFKSYNPEMIFHLAGVSSVKDSFENPRKTFNINVIGSLNVLEAVKSIVPHAKSLLVSSGDVYGESLLSGMLTNEEVKPIPSSPYGVSKVALDMLGRVYARSYNLNVVIARPFSHIGPRQTDDFFIPTVATQISEIKRGKGDGSLRLGDLNISRDFTDVRDVVSAYLLLMEKGRKGEAYNICSGKQYLLKDLVDIMIEYSQKDIMILLDKERLRENDLACMKPDNSKIINEIGWRSKIDIKNTLKDVLNYWIAQGQEEAING